MRYSIPTKDVTAEQFIAADISLFPDHHIPTMLRTHKYFHYPDDYFSSNTIDEEVLISLEELCLRLTIGDIERCHELPF